MSTEEDNEHLRAALDLALEHLRLICKKATSGEKCLLCNEVFGDPNDAPECPIPSAEDFLNDIDRHAETLLEAERRIAKEEKKV